MKPTRFRAGFLTILTLSLLGWPVQAVIVDRIVAIVNDTLITQSDVNAAFDPIRKKIEEQMTGLEKDAMLEKARQNLLNRMIDDILIEQEAAKLDIDISDEEVMGTIESILSKRDLTIYAFERVLEKEGLSLEGYKQDIRQQMIRSRVVRRALRTAISVTDEETGQYYARHRSEYEGEEAVRIKQIVLLFPEEPGGDTKKEMQAEMSAILERLKAGESFDKMAAQFSHGPTAKQGGDIGFVGKGIMTPELEQAAFSLEPGQVSDIIESPTGLAIITVSDKRGNGAIMGESLRDEIKNRIMETKMDKKIDEWIADLRKKAHISIKD